MAICRWGYPLLIAALASGCVTPAPVLRLSPRAEHVVWLGGTAVTSQQGKNIRAATAFVRQQDDRLVFRVEIENLAEGPVLVDPARFYYSTCRRRMERPTRTCNGSRYVANPEQALLALDMERSRQKAGAANEEAFLGAMVLLDVTAAATSAAAGNRRGTASALFAADGAARSLHSVEQRNLRQSSAYELDRANWATAALRKTTLFPGNKVAGLVFLDQDASANELSLQIRVGDEVLPFVFDQTAYQVRFEGRR